MDGMELFIHLAGFLGAWLLVAGPLFQAAVELRDEQVDREAFTRATDATPTPQKVSPWWWLLPPVAYVKSRRRSSAHRDAVLAALEPEQRAQLVGFMNKAHGWLAVAGGAFLIALKETWELVHLVELPDWVFGVAVVALAIGVFASTSATLARSDGALHADDPEYAAKRRAERDAQREAQRADRKGTRRP